ncbi:hypothetical protein GRI43_08120 [Altererythrobacter luteolus]|uniref:HTH luxR-type domain-containing protein n=1 Tax=Pontixanthobacter luteolus TaxID=295089 RepID=A0A6I4V0X8_9SPHN|nr:alpha/beta hydrolase [Pontixanthobacter luteolus]MXP47355.1 hypothetical protein [Pontixanthobacter luteolus]
MTEATRDQMLQDVVAKAYAAIASPEEFVELLHEVVAAEGELKQISGPIDMHFENAESILDKMYPLRSSDFAGLTTVQSQPLDCDLAIDRDFRVVAVNPKLFPTGELAVGQPIPDWLFNHLTDKEDKERLRCSNAGGDAGFIQLHTSAEDEKGRWFSIETDTSGEVPINSFTVVRLRWSERSAEAFQRALKLTGTEIALTRHLVEGGSVREFAEARGRSIGTARNQLKALQRKLSIGSKEDLLLLYAGFVHSLELPDHSAAPVDHVCENIFTAADGSKIAWEEFGDPEGRPVLFFHALEGPLVTNRVADAAVNAGLRFIAPWRPFYGATTGTKPSTDSPRQFASRMPEFLEYIGAARPVCVGTQAGTPFLLAMAQLGPERIQAALLVGPFMPIAKHSDYGFLPARQRVHFRISRMAPGLARVYMRAMLASMGTGDFHRFVDDYYEACPRELETVRDPEVVRRFRLAAGYGLKSGPDGAIDTMLNWSSDYSSSFAALRVPFTILVGDNDSNAPPDFVAMSCARLGLENAKIIDDAGSFLMQDQPAIVMEQIRQQF